MHKKTLINQVIINNPRKGISWFIVVRISQKIKR